MEAVHSTDGLAPLMSAALAAPDKHSASGFTPERLNLWGRGGGGGIGRASPGKDAAAAVRMEARCQGQCQSPAQARWTAEEAGGCYLESASASPGPHLAGWFRVHRYIRVRSRSLRLLQAPASPALNESPQLRETLINHFQTTQSEERFSTG